MNDTRQADIALEAELAALRPRDLPPGLAARLDAVAERAPDEASTRRRWAPLAATIGLAACAALAVYLWRANRPGPPAAPNIAGTVGHPDEPPAARAGPVTFAEYRAAYSGSPEVLDNLLARDASASQTRVSQITILYASRGSPDWLDPP